MNAPILRKIEASLVALVEAADDEHPIDPFEVHTIARRVAAQAEMIEEGLEA